jgi:uncharacterized protein involved in exopolysaccharide biosynthesis
VSRSLMVRLLETFFRRWYLYLVPLVILGVVGFLSISGTKSKFESTGTFNVEDSTVLSNLNGGSTNEAFGETPATTTSRQINSTLQTDQFIKDIATRSGLDQALQSGTITTQWIRSSLSAVPNGSNLVTIVSVNEDPQIAQRLARSTIDAYVQSVVDAASSQSTAATSFFGGLITTYQADVDTAQKALDDYVASHPGPAVGQRPENEQTQINKLNNAITLAQANLNAATSKNQDAELTTAQTKADVGQRLRLVDAPNLPLAPQPKMKKMIFSFGTFLALGLILAIGAAVLATLQNHTILSAADVKDRLGGVRLLAVVPEGGGRLMAATKVAKTKAPKAKSPKTKAPKNPPASRTRDTAPGQVKQLSARGRGPAAGAASTGTRRPRTAPGRQVGRATGKSGWPS